MEKQRILARDTISSARLLEEVSEKKEVFIGPQAVDLDLSTKYGAFLARIKTWFGNFTAASFDWDLVDEERRDRFRKVGPGWSDEEFPKMLNAPKIGRRLRPLFVQGWVGVVMAEDTFCCLPTNQYPGSYGRDYWLRDEEFKSLNIIEQRLHYAGKYLSCLLEIEFPVR